MSSGWFRNNPAPEKASLSAFDEKLPLACIHEAGHAVVALALGFGLKEVVLSVKFRDPDSTIGSPVEIAGNCNVLGMTPDKVSMVALAGAVAECLAVTPEASVDELQSKVVDRLWSLDCFNDIKLLKTRGREPNLAVPDWVQRDLPEVVALLRRHWSVVQSLAERVQQRAAVLRTNSGREVVLSGPELPQLFIGS